MNNAFLKSFECLRSVYVDRAFSSIELNKKLTFAKSSDKALITKLVYGVLDRDIELEYIIKQFVRKAKPDVMIFLKIGVYCLKYLSIPVYAVVNDVCELSKLTGDRHVVGFVNATLKNVHDALENGGVALPEDKWERMSVENSYPLWALLKLVKDYGEETAKNIVSFKLPTSTTVRVNTTKISVGKFERILKESFSDYSPTILPDAFAVNGRISVDPSLFTMQSLSSMLVARATECQGCDVLDSCAAPGGKSVYMKTLGAESVTACDVYEHRVALIENYSSRLDVKVDAVCADSTVFRPEWEGKFDVVLCDAPCSGFGVLDSRPDIKLFRENKDISELMKTQAAILDNCSRYVKKGGSLVYSTCTVFKNENSQIVDRFLASHDEFERGVLHLPMTNADGKSAYQFLPHQDGVQGFFCAKLKRI